ncbi:MAG: hypothetical protein ACKVQV_07000 [Bacteroidia bacterium]
MKKINFKKDDGSLFYVELKNIVDIALFNLCTNFKQLTPNKQHQGR